MKKIFLIIAVIGAMVSFFAFDLNQFLTLENIKASQAEFARWRASAPLAVGLGFFFIYVAVTALSLPGAAIMTLAGGALFGLGWGVLIISFASTIGATLAFLASRYLFRAGVQHKFGDRLAPVNKGVEREGPFYLFTLRLVPIFPFFLINLLMGLTPIKTWAFYWVSQLGMLPGTIVFVNAGTQLAQIDSLSGILSPGLLFSFVLLGIFPLIAKRLLDYLNARRIYRGWNRPTRFDRNLVVIGAGAAGLVTSYIGAAVKARVSLVEAHKMGGDCLNYGCVPSKSIIRSAKLAHQMRHAGKYGLVSTQPEFSFKEVMARVHRIIAKVEPHDSVERYTGLGVEVLQGYGTIVDPWTVEIKKHEGDTTRLTSRAIVVAAGGAPLVPPLPGLEEVGYLTSDTLWEEFATREHAPPRLVVLGGGPIGSELSQVFARLGSQVVQVDRGERILKREDPEVSELAMRALRADGVEILVNHGAVRCEMSDTEKALIVIEMGRGEERRIVFDDIICAVGRAARLTGYGLENLGVNVERTLSTNEYLQTNYPNIYGAGDVAGPYQFTHVAAHQAWYAAVNALFGQFKKFKADYSVIPWTTFIDPEVARVGLNEQEAIAGQIAYEVTRFELAELDRAITDSATTGFVKVLTPPGKDRILGVTIVAEHGGELLAEFVLAMKHKIGLNTLLGTIHTYPTMAEANKYVAGAWKRAHAPEKIIRFLEKYHSWRRG